ncbi:MAG: long-chain fatty acid--CoA ligase [Rickettsiales bacterium]|nr:long-chain fatty acid--CoA ligase [Rickettsiales bacterium]
MQPINDNFLKHYPKNINWFENIEPKPIYEILNYAVKNFPEKPAIDFFGTIISYKELGELTDKFALGINRLIQQSKVNNSSNQQLKIGIYMPNCPQFVIAYYAILKAGHIVVNYSPLYSEKELAYQIDDSDTSTIITLNLNLLYPKAKALLQKTDLTSNKLKQIIVADFTEYLPFPKNFLFKIFKSKDLAKTEFDNKTQIEWNEILKLGFDAKENYNAPVNIDETAIIQYTGGTTGTPKGAELTHKNVYINSVQSKIWGATIPEGEGSVLTILPLFHVFAMTTAMNFGVLSAYKLILHPRFDIKQVLKDIHNKKPTAMPGVATMYNAINNYKDTPKYNLKSLKVCISGGGPLPLEIKRKFEEISGCKLVEGYGLTESSPVASCNPVEGLNKEGSIGLPLPQTEILIEDIENRGKFLGINEIGELCIKGPQVMKGYYKRQSATDEVIVNGILRTGDIAKIDEDGYVFITDRLKEMIICGGFKVYPRQVEEALYQHPAVLECAVIGIPDDYSGQKVKAVIVLKPNYKAEKDDFINYCKTHLAKHEVPKEVEFRSSLPKSPVGKILKKELK